MTIATNLLSRRITVYSNLFGCHLTRKRIQDVSMCDGHHTILDEVAVCTGLSQCYLHTFKLYRRTYRPRTTGFDFMQGQWVILKLKDCKSFTYRIDPLVHVIKPACLAVTTHKVDAIRGLRKTLYTP